jgi:hypothetical protein
MIISFSSGSAFHTFAGEVLKSRTVMNFTGVLLAEKVPLCHSIVNKFFGDLTLVSGKFVIALQNPILSVRFVRVQPENRNLI